MFPELAEEEVRSVCRAVVDALRGRDGPDAGSRIPDHGRGGGRPLVVPRPARPDRPAACRPRVYRRGRDCGCSTPAAGPARTSVCSAGCCGPSTWADSIPRPGPGPRPAKAPAADVYASDIRDPLFRAQCYDLVISCDVLYLTGFEAARRECGGLSSGWRPAACCWSTCRLRMALQPPRRGHRHAAAIHRHRGSPISGTAWPGDHAFDLPPVRACSRRLFSRGCRRCSSARGKAKHGPTCRCRRPRGSAAV